MANNGDKSENGIIGFVADAWSKLVGSSKDSSNEPKEVRQDTLSKLGDHLWVTDSQKFMMERIADKYGFPPGISLNTDSDPSVKPLVDSMLPFDRNLYTAAWNEAFKQSTIQRESDGKLVWIRDQFDAELNRRLPSLDDCKYYRDEEGYWLMHAHATGETIEHNGTKYFADDSQYTLWKMERHGYTPDRNIAHQLGLNPDAIVAVSQLNFEELCQTYQQQQAKEGLSR